MPVVSVDDKSVSSLFAKVDIYWYPEWNGLIGGLIVTYFRFYK